MATPKKTDPDSAWVSRASCRMREYRTAESGLCST
jgi:hypothetical protein